MPNHEAFIRALHANSVSVNSCLVYADWLEERGEAPRAELIRLQCEIEGLRGNSARTKKLKVREAELLKKHRAEWTSDLKKIVGDFGFVRGVVVWAVGRANKFVDHADELFRLAPIQHLRLNDSKGVVEKLAKSSALQHLQTLCLESNAIGAARGEVLLGSSYLSNITTLVLNHNQIGLRGMRALAGSPYLARLKRLALVGNNLNDEALSVLGNARHLPDVRYLFLGSNPFSLPGLEALVNGPVTEKLHSLCLGWDSALGDGIVPILLSSPHLKALRHLMAGRVSERAQRRLKQRFGQLGCDHYGAWKPHEVASD